MATLDIYGILAIVGLALMIIAIAAEAIRKLTVKGVEIEPAGLKRWQRVAIGVVGVILLIV